MPDDDTPAPGIGQRAGAVLLVVLALGLLFIGIDSATGGKLTRGCGCNDESGSGD